MPSNSDLTSLVSTLVESELRRVSVESVEEAGLPEQNAYTVTLADEEEPVFVELIPENEPFPVSPCAEAMIGRRTQAPVDQILAGGEVEDNGTTYSFYVSRLTSGDPLEDFSTLDVNVQKRILTQLGEYVGQIHSQFEFDTYGELTGDRSLTMSQNGTQDAETYYRDEIEAAFDVAPTSLQHFEEDALEFFDENKDALEDTPSTLTHPYLDAHNIVVDEDYNIVALDGWDFSEAALADQNIVQLQVLLVEQNTTTDANRQELRNAFYMGYQRENALSSNFSKATDLYRLLGLAKLLLTVPDDELDTNWFDTELTDLLTTEEEQELDELFGDEDETEETEDDLEVEEETEDETEEETEETEDEDEDLDTDIDDDEIFGDEGEPSDDDLDDLFGETEDDDLKTSDDEDDEDIFGDDDETSVEDEETEDEEDSEEDEDDEESFTDFSDDEDSEPIPSFGENEPFSEDEDEDDTDESEEDEESEDEDEDVDDEDFDDALTDVSETEADTEDDSEEDDDEDVDDEESEDEDEEADEEEETDEDSESEDEDEDEDDWGEDDWEQEVVDTEPEDPLVDDEEEFDDEELDAAADEAEEDVEDDDDGWGDIDDDDWNLDGLDGDLDEVEESDEATADDTDESEDNEDEDTDEDDDDDGFDEVPSSGDVDEPVDALLGEDDDDEDDDEDDEDVDPFEDV